MRRLLVLCVLSVALCGTAAAQGRTMVLAADAGLSDSGLLDFLLPRFSLKHGVRVTVVPGPEGADAVLLSVEDASALADSGAIDRHRGAFHTLGAEAQGYAVAVVPDAPNAAHARTFRDWLLSDIGQRTVASFRVDGVALFRPGARDIVVDESPA